LNYRLAGVALAIEIEEEIRANCGTSVLVEDSSVKVKRDQ
jgi:hypothetical protein